MEFTSWNLIQTDDDNTTNLKSILEKATGYDYLEIAPLVLNEYKNYVIQINFKNFINFPGLATIEINSTGKSGIKL